MAIAFVQSNFNDANTVGTSETCAFTTQNVTAGNLIVVAINVGTNGGSVVPTITSVTDNNSNPYHQVFNNGWFYYAPVVGFLDNFGIYYAYNLVATPNGKPTITVNLSGTVNYNFNIVVMEFSGIATTSPLDKSAYYQSGSGSGGSPFTSQQTTPLNTNGSAGSTITTSVANELVIAFGGLAGGSSNPISVGSDSTSYITVHTYNAVTQNYALAYQILSATGSPYADFTGPGNPCFAAVATFKAGAAAVSSVPNSSMMLGCGV